MRRADRRGIVWGYVFSVLLLGWIAFGIYQCSQVVSVPGGVLWLAVMLLLLLFVTNTAHAEEFQGVESVQILKYKRRTNEGPCIRYVSVETYVYAVFVFGKHVGTKLVKMDHVIGNRLLEHDTEDEAMKEMIQRFRDRMDEKLPVIFDVEEVHKFTCEEIEKMIDDEKEHDKKD
jgi:hypothetical protein